MHQHEYNFGLALLQYAIIRHGVYCFKRNTFGYNIIVMICTTKTVFCRQKKLDIPQERNNVCLIIHILKIVRIHNFANVTSFISYTMSIFDFNENCGIEMVLPFLQLKFWIIVKHMKINMIHNISIISQSSSSISSRSSSK